MAGNVRAAWLLLSTFAATGLLGPVAGQKAAYTHLIAARAQLRASRLDSAALLLRQTLDTASHPTREDQVEAWILLGVIHFFKGDDSGTTADFRHALALDPLLKADGLANYDSALVDLFNAQRSAAVAEGGPPESPVNTVVDCTRTCPKDVVLPQLIGVEALEGLGPDGFAIEHHRYGTMIVQFIVDTAGRVAPASMRLISSNLSMKELERALFMGLQKASFTPGRANGQPVPVLVQGKLGFRMDRFEANVPIVPKRRRP